MRARKVGFEEGYKRLRRSLASASPADLAVARASVEEDFIAWSWVFPEAVNELPR
jgi:hypothetical protein